MDKELKRETDRPFKETMEAMAANDFRRGQADMLGQINRLVAEKGKLTIGDVSALIDDFLGEPS